MQKMAAQPKRLITHYVSLDKIFIFLLVLESQKEKKKENAI